VRLRAHTRTRGLQVEARYVTREEVALIQTTRAKKIAFSDRERVFVELSGTSSHADAKCT
jgi:hypothetical protein